MAELATQKHVQFILSVEKKEDCLESLAMEHLRMNWAHWGLTTLDLLGKLHTVDADEVVSWASSASMTQVGLAVTLGMVHTYYIP
ncbi:hypothetical protein L3X38_029866 [Prunus dulcis]|uniref:Prenyltransferase alpha-alpha toroid domain-containing protein n=1 Tax=Prunus dulcis TaxID=3755 RepID=A0AAD4VSN3_PRUDU|nr:hypothetical protein L3X38_029866 [Prunus dulcis]